MANAIRGDQTRMGYENSDVGAGDPYGTALDLTSYTDARICATVTPNFVAEELDFNTIGCGGQSGFGTDCAIENFEFRVTLAGDAGFQNGYGRLLAQFLGASAAPVEQTLAEGDWLHCLTFGTSNGHFGTFAYETSDDDVIELISTFTESISVSMTAGQPVTYSAVLTANDAECDIASVVNDNADLASLSFIDDEKMVMRCESSFRIKEMLDDGTDIALASPADLVPIISLELSMERPLEVIAEATGGDCNAPTESGALEGTLTVTFKEHKDNETLSYQNWKEGDFYQADVNITGDQINAGVDKSHTLRFPKLCLVDAPSYNVTDEGFNQYSLVFRILDSNNAIPGYCGGGTSLEAEFINQRSGVYLST